MSPHPIIDPPERYYRDSWEEPEESFLVQRGAKPLDESLKRRWIENRRGYRALIHLLDDQVGRILETLRTERLIDSTVIIYASDHGDMLGNFDVDGKNLPWRESSSVPVAVRHPDMAPGQVHGSVISLIDVTATILDVAGIDPVDALSRPFPAWNQVVPALSLMPLLRGETSAIREYTYTEMTGGR